MTDERSEVRAMLENLLRQRGDSATFTDDESLILRGRLQSIDVVDLVMLLEKQFGIDFAERGFDQNELESVNAILQLISESRR